MNQGLNLKGHSQISKRVEVTVLGDPPLRILKRGENSGKPDFASILKCSTGGLQIQDMSNVNNTYQQKPKPSPILPKDAHCIFNISVGTNTENQGQRQSPGKEYFGHDLFHPTLLDIFQKNTIWSKKHAKCSEAQVKTCSVCSKLGDQQLIKQEENEIKPMGFSSDSFQQSKKFHIQHLWKPHLQDKSEDGKNKGDSADIKNNNTCQTNRQDDTWLEPRRSKIKRSKKRNSQSKKNFSTKECQQKPLKEGPNGCKEKPGQVVSRQENTIKSHNLKVQSIKKESNKCELPKIFEEVPECCEEFYRAKLSILKELCPPCFDLEKLFSEVMSDKQRNEHRAIEGASQITNNQFVRDKLTTSYNTPENSSTVRGQPHNFVISEGFDRVPNVSCSYKSPSCPTNPFEIHSPMQGNKTTYSVASSEQQFLSVSPWPIYTQNAFDDICKSKLFSKVVSSQPSLSLPNVNNTVYSGQTVQTPHNRSSKDQTHKGTNPAFCYTYANSESNPLTFFPNCECQSRNSQNHGSIDCSCLPHVSLNKTFPDHINQSGKNQNQSQYFPREVESRQFTNHTLQTIAKDDTASPMFAYTRRTDLTGQLQSPLIPSAAKLGQPGCRQENMYDMQINDAEIQRVALYCARCGLYNPNHGVCQTCGTLQGNYKEYGAMAYTPRDMGPMWYITQIQRL